MSSQPSAFEGSCHCGGVRVVVSRTPDYVNDCNCTLCTKRNVNWIYYASDEVEIDGETVGYVRADLDEVFLATHFCPRCGVTTHWQPLGEPPFDRMGFNIALFDAALVDGVPVQKVDGLSW